MTMKQLYPLKLWQKAQDAIEAKRDYLAEGSGIEEFTEEVTTHT